MAVNDILHLLQWWKSERARGLFSLLEVVHILCNMWQVISLYI